MTARCSTGSRPNGIAKLRDLNTSDNRLLLHTNMEAGHGGASGRLTRRKETARYYAFLLSLAGRHIDTKAP